MPNEIELTKLQIENWDFLEDQFNEWLQNNLDELCRVIGHTEKLTPLKNAAGYHYTATGERGDIFAVDERSNRRFVIELQRGKTDDDHLRKCLKYTANFPTSTEQMDSAAAPIVDNDSKDVLDWLKAQTDSQKFAQTDQKPAYTVVWIAESVDLGRQVVFEWLNEHTKEDIDFYLLKVRFVRIGNSAIAPILDIVVKPSETQRRKKNPDWAKYESFWQGFSELCKKSKQPFSVEPVDKLPLWCGFKGDENNMQINDFNIVLDQYSPSNVRVRYWVGHKSPRSAPLAEFWEKHRSSFGSRPIVIGYKAGRGVFPAVLDLKIGEIAIDDTERREEHYKTLLDGFALFRSIVQPLLKEFEQEHEKLS